MTTLDANNNFVINSIRIRKYYVAIEFGKTFDEPQTIYGYGRSKPAALRMATARNSQLTYSIYTVSRLFYNSLKELAH